MAGRQGRSSKRRAHTIESAAVIGGAAIVELAIWWAMTAGLAPAAVVIAMHLATTGALVAWTASLRRRRRLVRIGYLATMSVMAAGPFGALGTMLALVARAAIRPSAESFEAWYFALFPTRDTNTARDLFEQLAGPGGAADAGGSSARVAAFIDLVRHGDVQQKMAVIALLARHFRPAFAPVLHAALADADASVRVQAATAVARIENRFVQNWIEAERRADARPSSLDAQLGLADLLDDYAFTGILDEMRTAEIQAKALSVYRHCLTLAPDNGHVADRLGRLMIRSDDAATALDILAPHATRPDAPRTTLGWYLEALYRTGQFTECERFARDNLGRLSDIETPDRLARSAVLWAGGRIDDGPGERARLPEPGPDRSIAA